MDRDRRIESIGDDPVGWAVKQMDRFNIELQAEVRIVGDAEAAAK